MESTCTFKLFEIRAAYRNADYRRAIRICEECLQKDETNVESKWMNCWQLLVKSDCCHGSTASYQECKIIRNNIQFTFSSRVVGNMFVQGSAINRSSWMFLESIEYSTYKKRSGTSRGECKTTIFNFLLDFHWFRLKLFQALKELKTCLPFFL